MTGELAEGRLASSADAKYCLTLYVERGADALVAIIAASIVIVSMRQRTDHVTGQWTPDIHAKA